MKTLSSTWLVALLAIACGSPSPASGVSAAGTGGQGGQAGDGGPLAPGAVQMQFSVAESWSIAPPASDPFSEYADGRVRCSGLALRREASWIEVSTTECNYATLYRQLEADIPAGSSLHGEISWATLASLAPAVGTLAFATGDEPLWSLDVPIPGAAGIVKVEFKLHQAMTAGSALYFNVRNHGYNTWQLGPMTLDETAGPG